LLEEANMLITTRRSGVVALLFLAIGAQTARGEPGALDTALGFQPIASPAGSATFLPQMIRRNNGDIVATWMELKGNEYVFELSVRHENQWSTVRTITSGPDLSHFSVDALSLTETADGSLVAYWQLTDRSGADKFATVIQMATSSDAGKTWSKPRRPYRNAAPGQHGFLSTFASDLISAWFGSMPKTSRYPGHHRRPSIPWAKSACAM